MKELLKTSIFKGKAMDEFGQNSWENMDDMDDYDRYNFEVEDEISVPANKKVIINNDSDEDGYYLVKISSHSRAILVIENL
jgi:hypothetical protein